MRGSRLGKFVSVLMIVLLTVSFLLSAGFIRPAHASSSNLVVNPGFENSLTGWSTSAGTAVYSVDSTTSHSGSFSAKGVETNTGSLGRLYQDVTGITSPGNQYQISGWIKTSNVIGAVVIALDYVGTGGGTPADGYVKEIGYVSGTQDWAFYQSPVFTLPPIPSDCQALWFLFDFNNGAGTAWWDDVSLVSTSVVSAPQLSAYLSPSQLTIQQGAATSTTTLVIKNTGNGLLSWSVTCGAGWISFSQIQGTLSSGLEFPVTIQVHTSSLPTGTQSASITAQSNGGTQTLTLTVNQVTLSPPIMAPPAASSGSGWGPAGDPLNINAWMDYNATSNRYDLNLALAPYQQSGFLMLNATERDSLIEQIVKDLKPQGFTIGSDTNISVAETPNLNDQQAIGLLLELEDLATTALVSAPDLASYFTEFGIKMGVQLSAAELVENYVYGISPDDIVIQLVVDDIYPTLSAGVGKWLQTLPLMINQQVYTPLYIAGPGENILITIDNLTGPTYNLLGPNSVDLNLQNVQNAFYESGEYLNGQYIGGIIGAETYEPSALKAGSFSQDLTFQTQFNVDIHSLFLFSRDYIIPTTEVRDPITPFLKIVADNVILDNLLFNSSSYTLSADVSLIDNSTGGNLTVVVPLLLDSSNSSAFLFTLDGNAIPFNLMALSDYGYYLTVNVNSSGTLIMSIPQAPSSLAVSTDEGTLFIFGNGWPCNVSLSLQCFDGADWINISNVSIMTSGTGDFVFGTNSTLAVNSNFVTFKASDLYGETAYTSVSADTITFDQLGVGSDFNGTLLVVDGTSYNVGVLPVAFTWFVGSVHTFAFQSPLIAEANAEQYVWTSTTGLSSLQSDSINVTTDGSVVGNYETACAPPGALAYSVVRGMNNSIYYRVWNGIGWEGWTVLPGATCDSPAAAILGNALHIVVRGMDGSTLWYGCLSNPADPCSFSGWTLMSGSTQSAPTLTSNGNMLCLVVRGLDNRIYYRWYSGSCWGSWSAVPTGATCDSPAAALLGNDLHIVVRGMDGSSLWDTIVDICDGTVVRGWTLLSGATSSKPVLACSGADSLCLVVRGMDNAIYYRSYTGSTDSWVGWNALPTGATSDGPAVTVMGSELCTVVRGMDGSTLWCGDIDLGTSSFLGWTLLSGATPSAPTLTS